MSKDVVTASFDIDGSHTFDVADLGVDPDDRDALEMAARAEAVERIGEALQERPEDFIDLQFWEAAPADGDASSRDRGMPEVRFELPVTVDEVLLESHDNPVEAALEILYSAPAFDGIDEEVIARLEVGEIR